MAWTERYVDAAADGAGNGTTTATSGANGAWTMTQAFAGATSDQRANVKAGTYARAGTVDNPSVLLSGGGAWFRGYNTTIGDIDLDQTLAKPLITYTTGSLLIGSGGYSFDNLSFQGTTVATGVLRLNSGLTILHRCRVENTNAGTGSNAVSGTDLACVSECWLKATSTATFVLLTSNVTLQDTVVTGGGSGAQLNTSCSVDGCTFASCGTDGLRIDINATGRQITVNRSTFYNCGSDGIEITAMGGGNFYAAYLAITNCMFANNGGYGINNSSGGTVPGIVRRSNNAFWLNTSGKEFGMGNSPSLAEIVEVASPFVNAPTDLSLLSTALSKGVGAPYPGTLENVGYSSYLDIGALQRREIGAARARVYSGF